MLMQQRSVQKQVYVECKLRNPSWQPCCAGRRAPRAASCGSDSWPPAGAAPSFTHRTVIGDGSGGWGGTLIPCAVLHPALDVLLEPPADPIQKRTGPWCSSLKLQKLRSFKRKGCREARGVFPKRSHESRCEQTNCFCLFLLIFSEQFMLSVNLLLELFFSEALETTTQTPVRSRGGWMRFKKQK